VTEVAENVRSHVLYQAQRGNWLKKSPTKEISMRRVHLTSAFAGALLLGLTTDALAVTGEFDNMCTQGLASGKEVKADCSVNAA
jgi:hypothetical protein